MAIYYVQDAPPPSFYEAHSQVEYTDITYTTYK